MTIIHHENNIREWSDGEMYITDEIHIEEHHTLILKNCTLKFSPMAGIFCLGKIEASNCNFVPIDPQCDKETWKFTIKGWKGIADIGKRHSLFVGCTFVGGRGRALNELKDHYISRYFGEIDDLEIVENWSEYNTDDISEGYEATYGGALITLNASIRACIFSKCRVRGDGGAIIATINVDIKSCYFERCRSGGDGGAVVMKSHGTLKDALFIACRAGDEGGAVLCDDTSTITRCHFKRCIARSGGGIATHAKARVHDCAFIRCIGTRGGGGVSGEVHAKRLVFNRCLSQTGGGAELDGASSIEEGVFFRCKATNDGGGLYTVSEEISLVERSRFIQCTARNTGGGARVRATIMRNCRWEKNSINTDHLDDISADHLYASGGSYIQSSEFEGSRYEKEGVLQFVLFESTMLQCNYDEANIDPNFPVLRSTIIPKPVDWFQHTNLAWNDINYMAISNGVPTIVIQQRRTRYADRVIATLEPDAKNVEIWDSKGVLSDEEKQEVRVFIARNYHPLMDHYFCRIGSRKLLDLVEYEAEEQQ